MTNALPPVPSKWRPAEPPPKPTALQVIPENIPAYLRNRPQWLVWKFVRKSGRWTKIPFDAKNFQNGSSTEPQTWSSFETALAAYSDENNRFDGIGYAMLPDEGIVGIDLDHVVVDRDLQPWTSEHRGKHWLPGEIPNPEDIVQTVVSYSEISPSGTGLRIFCFAKLWEEGRVQGALEVYNSGRYLTCTGHRLEDSPKEINEANLEFLQRNFFHEKPKARKKKNAKSQNSDHSRTAEWIIEKASKAENGSKFDDLFRGGGGGESQSEDDLALCSIIAFYAGPGGYGLVDSVFRRSGLFRSKWDESHSSDGATYGEMTIRKAVDTCDEFYDPRRAAPAKQIGKLEIVPIKVRRTPTKTVVDLEVRVDGNPVDLRQVTSADSSRRKAVEAIARRAGPDTLVDVENAVAAILLDASKEASKDDEEELPCIHEVLGEYIPPLAKLIYRRESKAFSEHDGMMSRAAFCEKFLNNETLTACSEAADTPIDDNGTINRASLIGIVQRELSVLWGDLVAKLPQVEDAVVDSSSVMAEEVRTSIRQIWTKPISMGLVKLHGKGKADSESTTVAERHSLISRVRKMNTNGELPKTWGRVHSGFDAWVRREEITADDGEIQDKVFLAMRTDLAFQVGVKCPCVRTQRALTTLGVKFDCIDPDPPVAAKTTNGSERLAVLSQSLTDELLYSIDREGLA